MRLCILISVVCDLTAFGSVQPGPGFDPEDVVREVHAHGGMTAASPGATRAGLRAGDSQHVPGRLSNPLPYLGGGQLDGQFLLDTNNTLVPAPGCQNRPAIAFDGANFLVAWEDKRSGSYYDICGARVTPQGTVLDPSGFVISQAPYDQQHPAIAFDGTDFLVVWQDFRRGYGFDIYGTRVTPQGTVLDPAGLLISNDPNQQLYPALAYDGADFLVVWQDNRNNAEEPDIYGARVTSGGRVLDSAGLAINTAPHGKHAPAVGFDNSNFLVVWSDLIDSTDAHIYGARVTPGGMVLDVNGFAISQSSDLQEAPDLDFDGTNYLVTWGYVRFGAMGIYGARVTPAGMVLDGGTGIMIAEPTNSSSRVGFDGANFFVAWSLETGMMPAYFTIYGARVTPDGVVLDTGSAAIVISRTTTWPQTSPAVGFDGASYLAVWQDERNKVGEPDIYGARVTPDGAVLDTGGLLITQAAREELAPAVASDNANFLAVWEDHRNGDPSDIYGARVTPDGTVLDAGGFVITQAAGMQGSPAIAFDGANFLVAWEDHRGGSNSDIYGARVTPGGAVLDPDGIAISPAAKDQWYPALAFGGANFLVVWQDYRGDSGYSDVYGARVTPGGAVLDPQGFAISRARYDQDVPAIGFDGTNFLAVWEDYRHGTYSDIYGARVTPGGTVLDGDGLVISGATKYQYAPVLAFGGSSFLVTWEDYRSSNNPDIYGAWVAPNGIVSNEGGVVRDAGNQTSLALARGTGSLLFLVYQGWAGTVGDKTYNTDRIWGDMNPNTGLGLEESKQPVTRGHRSIATVVRGVLFLGDCPRTGTVLRTVLLDSSGRKVLDLHPGANDVRALAPGVYFVRDAADEGGTRKIVVQH